jgi:hypothetical protein
MTNNLAGPQPDFAVMANNSLGPQSDFAAMTRSHRFLADELDKISNTSQFDTGHVILRELRAIEQRMNAKMDTMEQRVNAKIDTMEQRVNVRFDQIDDKIQAR